MILYLDASALVKSYIFEDGTEEVRLAIEEACVLGTHMISRVEVSAALAKAVRMKALQEEEAARCLARFRQDWPDLIRLGFSEMLIAHADRLAWDHGLRGYGAVHLAAADLWQDALGEVVTFAVFDGKLWHAAREIGLLAYPKRLPAGRRR
ncbi:MAG: type II toxin-antitoxin system VapC family toxin [Acidobacteriota bacterium]|jgi:predicted nucleic acid-binding protein